MKYQLGKANRLGNRATNQDRFAVVERPRSVLLVLADGMGGHEGGLLAANTLVVRFTEVFNNAPSPLPDPLLFLHECFVHAHHAIVDAGARQNPPITPRTTGVACIIQDGKAYWAHIGDSRFYVLRGGRTVQRTRDHSQVEELLAQGKLDEKRARTDRRRNQLTRCVGGNAVKTHEPTLGEPFPLESGDILLLCSDGLWSSVSDDELAVHFGESAPLAVLADQIAGKAESNSYPKSDNVSLVTMRWISASDNARESEAAAPTAATADPLVDNVINEIDEALARAEQGLKHITG
jgi:serine/threonine protein phosphatase PrpC